MVLSPLVIAARFNLLRVRVHGWIDRRFYRRKYDVQQVLVRFAIMARDETDMNHLAVEPVQVRVWLRMAPKLISGDSSSGLSEL